MQSSREEGTGREEAFFINIDGEVLKANTEQ